MQHTPLKIRDYLFFLALFLSRLGDQILLFLVPLVVYQLTGNVAWSGLAFTFETLPRYAFFPFLGALCDRRSPYTLMRISQTVRGVVCIAGIVGYWLLGGIGWLIAVSALCGVLSSQGIVAREVMLPQMFKGMPFERVLSVSQIAFQAGAVLGPMVAAFLLTEWPWEYVVLATALVFYAADVTVVLWKRASPLEFAVPENKDGSWLSPLKIAVLHVVRLEGLKRLILLAAAENLLIGLTLATSAAMVTGLYVQSDTYYAILQTAGVAATILILVAIARTSFSRSILGSVAFILMVVGGLICGVAPTAWCYAVGYVLIVGFDKMFNIYIRSTRQAIIPSKDYGKTTGVVILLNNATQPVAGLLVTAFAHGASAAPLILALSLLAGASGLILCIGPIKQHLSMRRGTF